MIMSYEDYTKDVHAAQALARQGEEVTVGHPHDGFPLYCIYLRLDGAVGTWTWLRPFTRLKHP